MIRLNFKSNLCDSYFNIEQQSQCQFSEAFRRLRASIDSNLYGGEKRCYIISSSRPKEGKTSVTSNLSQVLAETGKRILVIDGDLRKHSLTEKLNLINAKGFSNLIGESLSVPLRHGKIQDYGLRDILTLIELQKRYCIMRLRDSYNRFELHFNQGIFVDINWTNRPDSKRLGSVLVENNFLSSDEAEIALAQQKKTDRSLGNILLMLGMIDITNLQKFLSLQIMEAMKVAFEIKDGEFSIHPVTEDYIDLNKKGNFDFQNIAKELKPENHETSYLADTINKSICITDDQNIYFMPSGNLLLPPTRLLKIENIEFVIKYCKKKFDVILIDTPPISNVSDTLIIAPATNGVLLVVEVDKTNISDVKFTKECLENIKAKIIGVVMNKCNDKENKYEMYK